jgi:uncharacterized protein (TIGR02391 family)
MTSNVKQGQALSLSTGSIESISKFLGSVFNGGEISNVLKDQGVIDDSGESTKWKRLYYIFLSLQQKTKSSNSVLNLIRSFLDTGRYVGRSKEFNNHLKKINLILCLNGLELSKDGQICFITSAKTLDEAEERVKSIQSKFHGRLVHSEVSKYCNTELMANNYFHAVFEATKGLSQRIKEMSGVDEDGSRLVDKVFLKKPYILAINDLDTESKRSEQLGFAQLLKGCFAAIRNPLAHEPKILWEGENDASDYLTLISLLHRKLDNVKQVSVIGD